VAHNGNNGGEAAMFIQKPSKMNEMTEFDDGVREVFFKQIQRFIGL
jgi:hypothetical protein